jgi:hypothetical protein
MNTDAHAAEEESPIHGYMVSIRSVNNMNIRLGTGINSD